MIVGDRILPLLIFERKFTEIRIEVFGVGKDIEIFGEGTLWGRGASEGHTPLTVTKPSRGMQVANLVKHGCLLR